MAETETLKPAAAHHSYRRILSATSVLGGAAATNLLISMVRSKVVAQYLGKDGLGEMGIYMSVSGLVINLASFGLSTSGVRELAAAIGSKDIALFQSSRLTFSRLSWGLGVVGAAIMALGAHMISVQTLGTAKYASAVAWLSITVLFTLVGNYWAVLPQVSGQIARVGSIQVAGALGGAVISVACFIVWRKNGIVPALVLSAVVQALASLYLARDVKLPVPDASTRFSMKAAERLLTLGGLSLAVSIQTSVVAVVLRRLVLDAKGLSGVGIFQAAQGLSAMYATYILNAMGTDFLPRLSAAMHSRAEANRMINNQTAIALLLGLPGVVGTIVFAPWVIPIFYSKQFYETVPVLQVMAAGIFGRLLYWPLGMALVTADAKVEWFVGEVVCIGSQLLVAWLLLPSLGVMATAVASVAMSLVASILFYVWVRRLTGLRWSRDVYSSLGVGCIAIIAVLALTRLPAIPAAVIGVAILLAVSWYCLKEIASAAGVTRNGLVNRLILLRTSILQRAGKAASSGV